MRGRARKRGNLDGHRTGRAGTAANEASALWNLYLKHKFSLHEIADMVAVDVRDLSGLDPLTIKVAYTFRANVLAELERIGGPLPEKPINELERLAKTILSQQSLSTDEERGAAKLYLASSAFLQRRLEERNERTR